MARANLFHHKYNNVITKLIQEELDHFKNVNDDDNRIKLLYPYLQTIKIDIAKSDKSYEDAVSYKQSGNTFYVNKQNWQAIEQYNKGVLACPQNDPESRETLSILIANRSACLFDAKRYESALKDIDYVLSIKAYPQKLYYKLFMRKAKSHLYCSTQIDLVLDSYKKALKELQFAQISQKDVELKKVEILHAINELKTLQVPNIANVPIVTSSFDEDCGTSKNTNKLVNFNYKQELGRFAVAAKDIEIGTIVVDEPVHCAVLISDYNFTNCQHCMLSTDAPIACSSCCNIVFCSWECMKAASSYHKFECGFLKTLIESGVSINCHMALRIITQQPLNLSKTSSANCNSIYHLCRNEQLRKIEDNFHYTIMAIFLLRLLKISSYFGIDCDDSILTEDEILITKLMLKNLEILQFNAHEISELREVLPALLNDTDEENYKALYVGGGLYPTAALFNHSCDPSVIRYNIKSRIIVKTIKPIKKGEIIYENYGPIYTNMVREERCSFLLERYWFTCACQPCTEDWPLFKYMKDDTVKIRCSSKQCNGGIYMHEAFVTSACSHCKNTINVLPHLKALSELEAMLPKAEAFYKQKNYKEAAKLYITAMNVYYKHTIPPFPDWVKVQQRLRTCMISDGNKCIQYNRKDLK